MHAHLEIILPPVEDVEAAVKQVLQPFDEQGVDEDGDRNSHAFWDWYVIGGRWAGAKLEAVLDPKQKDAFFEELTKRTVTVSGLQCGKQTIEPATQIQAVDALWNEMFPDAPVKVCPFFSHFNDQYKDSKGFPDIMPLKDIPKKLEAERVIIAGPSWREDGTLEATYMVQHSMWNGVNFVRSDWDGSVVSAIEAHKDRLKQMKHEYAEKHTPQDDWLVVTVDYHS
jgi:hypothetical protein